MVATGYCPCEICCHPHADGLTYTGDEAGRGSVAIDPKARILKLGQKLYIEEYGYGIANDIGGAIKGWEIDLCFSTHQEALEWGIRLAKVYVIGGEQSVIYGLAILLWVDNGDIYSVKQAN